MKTEEFAVTGMRCASCAKLVEADAGALPGVSGAGVDLGAGKLRLTYDEAAFKFADLEAAIKKAGFGVTRM